MKRRLWTTRLSALVVGSAAALSMGSALPNVVGFADDLTLQVQGTGTLAGAVQLAQSHVIYPRGNDSMALPRLVQDRSALLMYMPSTADGSLQGLSVTASNGKTRLGTLKLAPPSQLPKSDQPSGGSPRVEYSLKAWSAVLPWSWLRPGLQLVITSDSGRQQTLSNFEFSAPAELVLQHVRIGMLTTPPKATALETNTAETAIDYFQKIPVARLLVSQYHPVQFEHITMPNGKVYTSASSTEGGAYVGDMREDIGKSLVSVGINLANYGINASAGSSQSQPGYSAQIVVHHSQGMYANGLRMHGLSGGNGMATLYETTGNEFSHELGHNFGIGHYPNGMAGSLHNRTTGWGYDAYRHRLIGNMYWNRKDDGNAKYIDGRPTGSFANFPFGYDAMAGGAPMGSVSRYTQHTGFVANAIQKALAGYGVVDPSSSTGYRRWNASTQSMDELRDPARRKPMGAGEAVVTLVGFYDPNQSLPSVIYPKLFGSYGVSYGSESPANNCRLQVSTRGTAFVAALPGNRLNAGEMNKFHVNVPLSMQPSHASVQCWKNQAWVTLASARIQVPADFKPQVTDVGKARGFGAMLNSADKLSTTLRLDLPLASMSALRDKLTQTYGPVRDWAPGDLVSTPGQVFEYQNPYNSQTEYFMLASSRGYWYFPINQSSNGQWKFLGSAAQLVNFAPNPLELKRQGMGTADDAMLKYYGVPALQNYSDSNTGTPGDIYAYNNPYSGKRDYFRLMRRQYWYFPIDQTSNQTWQYLGNATDIQALLTSSDRRVLDAAVVAWYRVDRLRSWGDSGTSGTPGDIYAYDNPYSGKREYFRLLTSSYWYFPINQADNANWQYLGR